NLITMQVSFREQRVDGELSQFGRAIEQHFLEELDSALSQLSTWNNGGTVPGEWPESYSARINILNNPPDTLQRFSQKYPYFDAAAWTDKAGKQKSRWIIYRLMVPALNVSPREYFQHVKD